MAAEEAIEVANNKIRVARERRPAAAAELTLRSSEFDAAQATYDEFAPKKKAPADVPTVAAQRSGGVGAIDLLATFSTLVTAMAIVGARKIRADACPSTG